MFKQFMKILHTGAAVMWFTKIQHHGPAEVKVVVNPVVPTTAAMVAMLNPVLQLGAKVSKVPRKKRQPVQQAPVTAATRLNQLLTAPFIGPVQPPRRLTLPRPDCSQGRYCCIVVTVVSTHPCVK